MSYRIVTKVVRPVANICQRPSFVRMSTDHGKHSEDDIATPAPSTASAEKDADMPFIVGHDKKKKEFYINMEDGGVRRKENAILQYEWIRPNYVDLYHTLVPPVYRGQGIAKILAKTAMEHFAAEDIQMKLSCTYLQKYALDTRLPRVWDHIVWDD